MNILLVGGGGYASGYVDALMKSGDTSVNFKGIVDPYFSSCTNKEDIEKANIPVYSSMEEFYRENQADLAIISTPPFLHCEQSIYALSHGSYVLCEKPIAPTITEAEAMLSAEEKYKKWIAIGYQWSFSKAIQDLKKDVLSGMFGKPLSFKTAISWPRDLKYYSRGTGWAGKLSRDGVLLLDSIASNGCAHYLHNMFFLLGDKMDTSASVDEYEANCFRANNIESFDTCSIKMKVKGTQLYLIASHSAQKNKDPEFIYKFENATVAYSEESHAIKATFSDGTVKHYGDPSEDTFKKLRDCIGAVQKGITPVCTVKTAIPHTKLIEKMYYDIPINNFPEELIVFDEKENRVFVEGLYEKMYYAYDNEILLQIK